MENIIKSRRKELGLSQEGLAKKCGVSRQTVNAIENNTKAIVELTTLVSMYHGKEDETDE